MRTRDQIGLAVLACLWGWSENGPDRPILSAELCLLLQGQLQGLTPAELESGLAWASGITQLPAIRDHAPLAGSDELTGRIAQILREAGEYPPVLSPRTWLAMVDAVSDEEAIDVGAAALQQDLPTISETAFRKGTRAADPAAAGSAVTYLCDTLMRAGRYDEAITACDEAAVRFADVSHDLDGLLASLLYNGAVGLRDQPASRGADHQGGSGAQQSAAQQPEPASIFADIAARFAGSPDIRARITAAKAKVNESGIYLIGGDAARAEQACVAFLSEFDSAEPCPWWDQIAKALVNQAVVLSMLDRPLEAAEVCAEVYRRFGEIEDPLFQEMIARAAFLEGTELVKLGRRDAAVSAFQRSAKFTDEDGMLGEFARRAEAASRALVTEDRMAQIAAYESSLAQPYDRDDPQARRLRAALQVNRGSILASLDQYDEAVRAYDELISDIGHDTDPELRSQLAFALLNRGNALCKMEELDKAMLCYQDLARQFGDAADERVRVSVAKGIYNQGFIWSLTGDASQAIAAYQRVDDRCGSETSAQLRGIALAALWDIVIVRNDQRDVGGIVAAINRIVERFGADPSDELRRRVAMSLLQGAGFVAELGSDGSAFSILSTLASYDGDADPEVRDLAGQAATFRFAFMSPE